MERYYLKGREAELKTFELELTGFNGGASETDHLIKWIGAKDAESTLQFARVKGWDVRVCLPIDVEPYFFNGLDGMVLP